MTQAPFELRRTTLADRCYEHLLEALLDGSLRPGERLAIDALCESLHVSRQPLMEAIKRLEYEGFFSIHPQVGCRVVDTPLADAHEFLGFLAGAEALCARLAAMRRTPADAERISELCAALGALPAQAANPRACVTRFRALDEELHATIRSIGNSSIVNQISAQLWHRADFLITSAAGAGAHFERLERAQSEHEAIVDAIIAGEPDEAAALMEAHVLGFGTLLDSLP